MKPTEWKYGELSEPRESRFAIEVYEAITRRGMHRLPLGA